MRRLAFVLCLIASAATGGSRDGFILGGQLPFWLIAGERGTPSYGAEADAARRAILPRANQMFDIIIPSAISWDWVEPRRGRVDYHRYRWANDWAQANGKQTLTQHLFWMWRDSKPRWVRRLRGDALRAALHQHIADIRVEIGPVQRLTVINEMICKDFLKDRLGPEIVRELFVATRQAFPDTALFLNEHVCPNERFNATVIGQTLERYADFVIRLDAAQVPFDHVGFQLYFGAGDVEALGGVDRFVAQMAAAISGFSQRTGRPLFITELGFAAQDEAYRARFLQAFFTMLRDHGDVEGLIVFHWLDDQQAGTALVNRDGSLTLAGGAFVEVFDR